MKLVLASNNAKKLSELRALLADLPLSLVAQGELGIPEPEEPHHTFIENALLKARQASRASGAAAIADDSGMCVDALGGAPGVASAHYAALPAGSAAQVDREARRRAQDAANNVLLLQRLQHLPAGPARRAQFVCTLVALRHADDPQPLVAVGRWPGEVLSAPRGNLGFGYDPLMSIPELGCTVAELDATRKNQVSHRARAMAQMLALLREHWLP